MLTREEIFKKYGDAMKEELEYIGDQGGFMIQDLKGYAPSYDGRPTGDEPDSEEECCGCCEKLSFQDELYGYTMRRCADAGVDITYDELDYIVSVMMDFTLD